MTDFFTWWLEHKDCYFDIQLKSMVMEEKCGHDIEYFKIVECVELPNKDIWLGFVPAWVCENEIRIEEEVIYYKLSDINLTDYTNLFFKELKGEL